MKMSAFCYFYYHKTEFAVIFMYNTRLHEIILSAFRRLIDAPNHHKKNALPGSKAVENLESNSESQKTKSTHTKNIVKFVLKYQQICNVKSSKLALRTINTVIKSSKTWNNFYRKILMTQNTLIFVLHAFYSFSHCSFIIVYHINLVQEFSLMIVLFGEFSFYSHYNHYIWPVSSTQTKNTIIIVRTVAADMNRTKNSKIKIFL